MHRTYRAALSIPLVATVLLGAITTASHAAVDESSRTDQARIELRGTLDRDGNRTVVRAAGAAFQLEFPTSSLREVAAGLIGETVVVRGDLKTRRQNGTLRLTVRAEYIAPENGALQVSMDDGTLEVPRYEPPAPVVQTRPAPRYEPPPPAETTYVENEVISDEYPRGYTRVDSRRRNVLNSRPRHNPGSRVFMTPGGGAIILNY